MHVDSNHTTSEIAEKLSKMINSNVFVTTFKFETGESTEEDYGVIDIDGYNADHEYEHVCGRLLAFSLYKSQGNSEATLDLSIEGLELFSIESHVYERVVFKIEQLENEGSVSF